MRIGNILLTSVIGILLVVAVLAAATGTMLIIDSIYRLCVK
jgi:hypothetical protein